MVLKYNAAETKSLGVTVDEGLKWKELFNTMKDKVHRVPKSQSKTSSHNFS